ncbi:NAD-dependent epimerase/dehydratase family protein [Herbaspirillum sp. HC18]|nr:NAD-dependent epimerase/dehydratase family protein [Herbaspirillum sp. HC18]
MTANDTILVTGAAGFIGSAVAARLAAQGRHVVGCDNFNDYYSPRLKHARVDALLRPAGVPCLPVELSDEAQMAQLFAQHRPQRVIHLAAQAGVRYSLRNPAAYVQSNLVAFGHLIEACRRHEVRHLVYASSSSVYGANARVPFSESDTTDAPLSLYAATKKSNELSAYCYSHLYGLPATGLRFFTVYGPWGRPDMACYSFTERMLAGQPITVFAEGALQRDFTYVDDIVEGVVRVLDKPPLDSKPPHAVFNIGNHNPVRVMDFIGMLETVLGVRAQLEFLPMQPGDMIATCADTTRLREWVGFAPSTPLEEGLGRFAAWFREFNA